MSNLIILSFALVFSFSSAMQNKAPDLTKPEDIKALGIGKIIEKDNSVIKNINLLEIKEYWIVYEKNSSTHDKMMDVISRIEFTESKWGPLKLEFHNNKPETHYLNY
ncbi:MAG: hypothetical protein HY841_06715 [Bacteroidetes bacterium]|nr:hypothetical protein [Bacteroidota bacterium]